MACRITFLGAAGGVTGSCHLLETGQHKILVDCGMFQERDFRDRNWERFPFDPSQLDAVLLTHAHLDHVGRLPLLVAQGFQGPIYGSKASLEIAAIVLLDAGHLQEEDARQKQKRHQLEKRSGAHPAVPLYDVEDVEACLPLFRELPIGVRTDLLPGAQVHLTQAGHILGATSIHLSVQDGSETKRILFSGDIGRWNAPILHDPELSSQPVDALVIESTYGNRVHEDNHDVPARLAEVIHDTHQRGGNIIIPTFAVERAQDLLYHLSALIRDKTIPPTLVFLDSPMAARVTEIFKRHEELMDDETVERMNRGIRPWNFAHLKTCRTREQSKAINLIQGTIIVLAGSGMCTGGRVKHHLLKNIGRDSSTILFVGYQANGTLGRRILDGDNPVRILGREHEVRAKIERIEGFSGHADQEELIRWSQMLPNAPAQTFIVHGEKSAARTLAEKLSSDLQWRCTVPYYRETHSLD